MHHEVGSVRTSASKRPDERPRRCCGMLAKKFEVRVVRSHNACATAVKRSTVGQKRRRCSAWTTSVDGCRRYDKRHNFASSEVSYLQGPVLVVLVCHDVLLARVSWCKLLSGDGVLVKQRPLWCSFCEWGTRNSLSSGTKSFLV